MAEIKADMPVTEIKSLLDERTAFFYEMARLDCDMLLAQSIAECESPIEQMLAIAVNNVIYKANFPYLIEVISINNQEIIRTEKSKYRADMCITMKYWDKIVRYVIECDGHEFHQKTKQQVEKDNIRMREMQKQGIVVIRFSGTEIYKNPYKCAYEVLDIIMRPAVNRLKVLLLNEVK